MKTWEEKENRLELSNFQNVLTSRTWRPLACKIKNFTNFIILSLQCYKTCLYSWLTWLRNGSVKQRVPWSRCIKAEVKHRRMRKWINFGWPRDNVSPKEIINVKWNMQNLNWNANWNQQIAFFEELQLKRYTLLIHRDLLACVVVKITPFTSYPELFALRKLSKHSSLNATSAVSIYKCIEEASE